MATYIALLRKDPDSDYGIDFPDFPGCITAASTLEEARVMAAEALGGHIECMIEDGETIPEPSPLHEVMADPFNADAVPILVPVPDLRPDLVHVDLALPEEELRAIDTYAGSHGTTRSALLLDAARRIVAEGRIVAEACTPAEP